MRRFFTPLFFIAAAGFVTWYNGRGEGQVLAFPFVEWIAPSTKGDPAAMGKASVWLLLAVGALTGISAALRGTSRSVEE